MASLLYVISLVLAVWAALNWTSQEAGQLAHLPIEDAGNMLVGSALAFAGWVVLRALRRAR